MKKKTHNRISSLAIVLTALAAGGLTGCNTASTNEIAYACEQAIDKLSSHLNSSSLQVNQVIVSRASSLLLAAQVQNQFAEYPGCLDKVKRANDYLSGQQTAIVSRLSI